jgi:HAD superfamily hydrolase (TIGR01549 family)
MPFTLSEECSRSFWLEYFRHLLEALGEGSRPDLCRKLVPVFAKPEKYELYGDVIPVLKEIKSRGLILGMISNWEGWLLTRLHELKAAEYFDHIVISAIFGIEKPAPEIFLEALRLAGVRPQEALHVGDSLENDYLPASRLGMQAMIIDRRGRPAGNNHHTIRTLGELLEFLQVEEEGKK